MRVGLIADIHGNLVSLDAVLTELQREGVDGIVCLGDVAVLGPQPGEVIGRLRALGCPCVLGNTDAWLLDQPSGGGPAAGGTMADLTAWCGERLSSSDHEYLATFPAIVDIPLPTGQTMRCVHGSPRSYDEVIAATTRDEAVAAMLADPRPAILAGGHTHVQLFRRVDQTMVVNPGSVGLPGVGPGTPDLPVNRDVAWAEYGIIEATATHLSVELRRTAIDLDRVLAAARDRTMPHLDWWRALWATRSAPDPA